MRFNRTFMELKLQQEGKLQAGINRFNRTFMELKLKTRVRKRSLRASFNRTFMELKSYRKGDCEYQHRF